MKAEFLTDKNTEQFKLHSTNTSLYEDTWKRMLTSTKLYNSNIHILTQFTIF